MLIGSRSFSGRGLHVLPAAINRADAALIASVLTIAGSLIALGSDRPLVTVLIVLGWLWAVVAGLSLRLTMRRLKSGRSAGGRGGAAADDQVGGPATSMGEPVHGSAPVSPQPAGPGPVAGHRLGPGIQAATQPGIQSSVAAHPSVIPAPAEPVRTSPDFPSPPNQTPANRPAEATAARLITGTGPEIDGGSIAGQADWLLARENTQPGVAADAATLGDLQVRAASVVGPSHRCEEPASPRQDAYIVTRSTSGDHLIICVADGVSNASHSDLGARVAVTAAARETRSAIDAGTQPGDLDVQQIFRVVAGEMVGTALSRGVTNDALVAVLGLAVIPSIPDEHGGRIMWTSQIGDVSLWTRHGGGFGQLTGSSKRGLDRNAPDAVLPHQPHLSVTRGVPLEPGQVVILVTDGVGDPLAEVPNACDYFHRSWASVPSLAEFVYDLCFDARGQLDDRTAVAVWCGPKKVESPTHDARTDHERLG